MPYRRQIVAVSECHSFHHRSIAWLTWLSVGNPIHVEQCDKPSLEEVMRVQQRYIEELTRCVYHSNI
jgi:hypothetical protein